MIIVCVQCIGLSCYNCTLVTRILVGLTMPRRRHTHQFHQSHNRIVRICSQGSNIEPVLCCRRRTSSLLTDAGVC